MGKLRYSKECPKHHMGLDYLEEFVMKLPKNESMIEAFKEFFLIKELRYNCEECKKSYFGFMELCLYRAPEVMVLVNDHWNNKAEATKFVLEYELDVGHFRHGKYKDKTCLYVLASVLFYMEEMKIFASVVKKGSCWYYCLGAQSNEINQHELYNIFIED